MSTINAKQSKYHRFIIAATFVVVITIWSTTPIAIKWSGEGVSYLFGITARMSIGLVLAMALVLLKYKKLAMDGASRQVYLASALAIFGGMMPVYWGAQYVSSGLVSVLFGLSPIVTGYLAWRFLYEKSFSQLKIMGALAGIAGLLVIFYKGHLLGKNFVYGAGAILMAVILHSISSVWIKRLKSDMPALSLVAGGLLFSMPLFIAVYLLFAPSVPENIPLRATWSIIYLGVVGSVVGFMGYYFLLKHLPATSVALITLITPVLALWIGYIVNNEVITASIYIGTACVLSGLILHQSEEILAKKLWKKRKHYSR